MRIHRALVASAFVLIAATPVRADKAAYCQAYARDFSDQRATDKAEWQHKYQIALDACLATGKPAAVATKPAATDKPAVAATTTKPVVAAEKPAAAATKPVAQVTKPAAAETVKAAGASDTPKLVAGSAEWNDYCAKKYTSFDAKTGMYLSHSGISRHCVVSPPTKG